MNRSIAALLAVTLTSCAIMTTKAPPDPVPATGPIECDTSAGGGAVVDILGAVVGFVIGLGVGTGFTHCPEDGSPCDMKDTSTARGVAIGAAIAVPFAASIFFASRRASRCSALKRSTGR